MSIIHKIQGAGVTLLPLESPLNTRVFEADFEGVGYVYLPPIFGGKSVTFSHTTTQHYPFPLCGN